MRILAKNAARPWGFTLIELLTVIAIIAVLATLTSATLSNAQRKGRKALSISNLRQIAVAFNLYVDDRDKRPTTFLEMTEAKYLTERVLLCPEDRVVKNWAGILEETDTGRKQGAVVSAPNANASGPDIRVGTDVAHSYFKSFDYHDEIWEQIHKSSMGGIAACQLHGIGRQDKDKFPSITAYQGLVLRALKDGSVVPRQVFWSSNVRGDMAAGPSASAEGTNSFPASSQLPLFIDPAE